MSKVSGKELIKAVFPNADLTHLEVDSNGRIAGLLVDASFADKTPLERAQMLDYGIRDKVREAQKGEEIDARSIGFLFMLTPDEFTKGYDKIGA